MTLSHQDGINPASLKYLNRLSDLLFVVARTINKEAGQEDIMWRHARE